MTDERRHFGEEIQQLLDGRLAAGERSRLEEHLADCAQCRQEQHELGLARRAIRTGVVEVGVPGDVIAGVTAALDREDRRLLALRTPAPARGPWRARRIAYALLATAAAVVFFFAGTGWRQAALPPSTAAVA